MSSEARITIRTLLMRDIGGLFLVALAAMLAVTLYFGSQGAFVVLRENSGNVLKTITKHLNEHFAPAVKSAQFIGRHAMLERETLSPQAIEMARTAMALHPQIRGMAFFWNGAGSFQVLGPDAQIETRSYLPGSPEAVGVEEAGRIGVPFVADPIFSKSAGVTLVTARAPIFENDGSYVGMAVSAISVSGLSAFVRDVEIAGGTVFVLNSENRVVAHPLLADDRMKTRMSGESPLLHATEIGDPVLEALMDPKRHTVDELEDGEGIEVWTTKVEGRKYYALSHKVAVARGSEYTVGVFVDQDSSSYTDLVRYMIYGGIAGLLVMAAALFRLRQIAERIRRPVSELATASNSVARLDLDTVPPVTGNAVREFNEAANAFNTMIAGLTQFGIYVPRSLVREIMTENGARGIASVDREITVLFSDIAGFTSISQSRPAGEIADMLNAHFTLMNDAIEAEGGNIDKYVGDSVMAFWGAPAERPDHAAACLRAARRIAELVHEDNIRRQQHGLDPIHVRMGIATGRAIVGNIGAPGRINYTMIGDTVNVANRLEQLGKDIAPGAEVCVLVSQSTADAAKDEVELVDEGLHELRGRSGAVHVYRLDTENVGVPAKQGA